MIPARLMGSGLGKSTAWRGDYDIQLAGGLRSMLFGGEGLLLTTLKGTGSVWIQSLPFSRLAERVYEATYQARGETRAGGK